MATKTERVTIWGSSELKAFLTEQASKEHISVSELVRRRCEQHPWDAVQPGAEYLDTVFPRYYIPLVAY